MINILDSIQPVLAEAKHVRINQAAIDQFCESAKLSDLEGSEFVEDTTMTEATAEERIAFCFVDSALNFCYWGEPKWTIQFRGEAFDGSAALIRCLKRAIDNDYPLLKSSYLATMPEADLAEIFKGSVPIPLFAERLEILHDLGRITEERFGGSFTNIVHEGKWDAIELTSLIIEAFPTIFDDSADYHGHRVGLYKRAQLVPIQLHDLHGLGLLKHQVTNFGQLTTLADYKIPQLLRKFRILEYTPELAKKVDTLVELPEGSEEEVEIRAATIWAIELVTRQLKQKWPEVYATRVGILFWLKGQVKSPDDKPYHRTLTIWY